MNKEKLKESQNIVDKMTMQDHKNPTVEQRDAKEFIYLNVIKPKYPNDCPMLEPDFNEGWK